jgi:hypothetical protein
MADITSDQPPFGRHIPQSDAQRMYLNFYKIKERTNNPMRQALATDDEALRYHAGRFDQPKGAKTGTSSAAAASGPNPCSFLDSAFVFDKRSIHRLMNPSSGVEPDGIIIFMGSRNMEDSLGEAANKDGKTEPCYMDVDGRPTLLAFPVIQSIEPNLRSVGEPVFVIQLDDGEEHPGTGGGGNGGGGGVGGGGATADIKVIKLMEGVQPAGTTLPIDRKIPEKWAVSNFEHMETRKTT